jgi:hemolysin activation/secretion protein
LAGEIKQYAIKHDRVVNVLLPTQQAEDVAAGILRLGVVVSRYHELDFKGNRWFSSQLLKDKLGIHPGDEISIARLDEAVNWANTNPFRRLQVLLMPVDQKTGTTNLIVGVQERLPVRLMVSYDDTGSEVIGKRHYTGSLHYGNFLGRDHQLSYQFTTTDHQSVYRAQSLTYEVPLPWRHKLTLSASYLELNPMLYGVIAQTGRNAGADLRYTWPMSGKDLPTEFLPG